MLESFPPLFIHDFQKGRTDKLFHQPASSNSGADEPFEFTEKREEERRRRRAELH